MVKTRGTIVLYGGIVRTGVITRFVSVDEVKGINILW